MMMDNLTTKEKQIDQAFKNEASQSRYSAQTRGLIKSRYLFSLEKKKILYHCIFSTCDFMIDLSGLIWRKLFVIRADVRKKHWRESELRVLEFKSK